MTVWAVCAAHGDDVGSVIQDFGQIRYINQRYVFIDELTDDDRLPHEFERNLSNAAVAFNAQHDYLLLVGDHLQLVALTAMIQQYHRVPFRVLRYDRKAGGHVAVWIG